VFHRAKSWGRENVGFRFKVIDQSMKYLYNYFTSAVSLREIAMDLLQKQAFIRQKATESLKHGKI